MKRTSIRHYLCIAGQPTEYYRAQLGAFGLSGDLALRPVVALSGGQKSRVAFTLMCMHKLVVTDSRVEIAHVRRVVSSEISSGKFPPEISRNLFPFFRKFPENCRNDFTEIF